MSLIDRRDGHYDENGHWQRDKFCFVYCGASCTCSAPGGQIYSFKHDFNRRLGFDLWAWLKGYTVCEDCDGSGYSGEWWPGTAFQPPEPEACRSCGGSGFWEGVQ